MTKVFFDTNVLLYALDPDSRKGLRAAELIEQGGTISVQVLNEFIHVARRKFKLDLPVALETLSAITDDLEIVPVTIETHVLAMRYASSNNFSVYDCNIIAAADLAGCDFLYSEDMHPRLMADRVEIRNPFK